MLTSLALLLLTGLLLGALIARCRLPALLGMLAAGLLLGPHALNLLDGALLGIAADLRQLALIIILLRAGLSLHAGDLRSAGRPALLLCFVPACFEIAAVVLLAPPLLGLGLWEAALLGSVLAAVSPAVVVPRMLRLLDAGYGADKRIPQMIMAGASVDDVFVLVLFAAFAALAGGEGFSPLRLLGIPLSIALGAGAGMLLGSLLSRLFQALHLRDTVKILILLSAAFLLVALEGTLEGSLPFSGLLAVLFMGMGLLRRAPALAGRLSARFARLWVPAEILLFGLVGATVDLRLALSAGGRVLLLLLVAAAFRMAGVYAGLLRTGLTRKERGFCMIAYLPKATVQAAIGGIPLALGLPSGALILTAAVLSILLTAPLGALGIDLTYKKWLRPAPPGTHPPRDP